MPTIAFGLMIIVMGTAWFFIGVYLIFKTVFHEHKHKAPTAPCVPPAPRRDKIYDDRIKQQMQTILSENEKLKDKVRKTGSISESFHAKLEAIAKENEGLKNTNTGLEQKIDNFMKEISGQKEEIDKDKTLTGDFKMRLEEIVKENSSLKEKIEGFTKNFNDEKENLQSALDDKSARLEVIEKELRRIRAQEVAVIEEEREAKDWEEEIERAGVELLEIRRSIFEQDKMVQDVKKGIRELKREERQVT